MTDQHLTADDRLDAVALLRAHVRRDPQAVRVLLNTAGPGMYMALLDLSHALLHAVSAGQPEEYLDHIVKQLNGAAQDD